MKEEQQESYTAVSFPRMRQLVLDAGWISKRKHMMHGFIEVDVTLPKQLIAQQAEQTGRKLSFSAFILACIGEAVAQDNRVQAMRDWRNRRCYAGSIGCPLSSVAFVIASSKKIHIGAKNIAARLA